VTSLAAVLNFVSSLIWPAAVIWMLFRFRSSVKQILDAIAERVAKVERVKGPGFEAAWSSEAVEDVAREAGASQSASSTQGEDNISVRLAKIKPAAGVVDAYLDVEKHLRRYIKNSGTKYNPGRPPAVIFRRTEAPDRLKHVVADLAALRNAAAHGAGEITEQSAIEYTRTAAVVARELDQLADDALGSDT